MSWHGQINRTIWEIQELVKKQPKNQRYRRELLRAHFLQHFEFDKAFHVARDDRTFLFLHDKETPAVLLLHGAEGTPAEMRELGNYLYSRGFSVYCPRLSRVDTKERMVSWESWVTQSETALETLTTFSRNTFVVGLSFGGTIAINLSRVKGVRGIAVLAPALFERLGFKGRLSQIGRFLTPTLFYRFAGWRGEVLKAMEHVRKHTKKIGVPVVAVQAEDDRHLSPRGLKFVRRHASSKTCETKMLAEGTHVLTRGPAKAEVFELVANFLTQHVRAKAGQEAPEMPTASNVVPMEPFSGVNAGDQDPSRREGDEGRSEGRGRGRRSRGSRGGRGRGGDRRDGNADNRERSGDDGRDGGSRQRRDDEGRDGGSRQRRGGGQRNRDNDERRSRRSSNRSDDTDRNAEKSDNAASDKPADTTNNTSTGETYRPGDHSGTSRRGARGTRGGRGRGTRGGRSRDY